MKKYNFNFKFNYSLLLSHPRVTHVAPKWMNSSDEGRQTGRAKSERSTGLSILRTTREFPSTGDLTMPTILLSCSQGARLLRRTEAKRATHLERPCLWWGRKSFYCWKSQVFLQWRLLAYTALDNSSGHVYFEVLLGAKAFQIVNNIRCTYTFALLNCTANRPAGQMTC